MPNPVAANDLQPISGSLQTSRISYGVETAGKNYGQNYNSTTWYSDIPNDGQRYTIITDNYTANYYVSRSQAEGGYVEGGLPAVDEYSAPVFWQTVGTSSLDVITIVNGLPDRVGQTPFVSGAEALNWVASSSNYFAVGPDYYNQMDADNLQVYLNANQVISYPTTGSTWYDLSGYNNNATLINGPSFNSNGWIRFDGVDDRAQFSTAIISGSGDFTLSAFVQKEDIGSVDFILGNYGVGNNGVELYWYSNGVVYFYATGIYIFSSTPYNDTRWHHVVGTRINGVASIYVDGRYDGGGNLNISIPSANPLTIGNGYDYTSEALKGSVSEVAIYPSKGLTIDEVIQNYYGGPIVTGSISGSYNAGNLVSYEPGTTTTYNMAVNIISGSLQNGVGYSPAFGGYWSFDGVDDRILLETSTTGFILNANTNWTVTAWVRTTTTVNGLGQGPVFSNSNSGPVYSMMGIGGGVMVYWHYNGTWLKSNGTITVNDGNWHMLTWVNFSNSTMDLYVDGKLDTAGVNSALSSNNPLDIIGCSWAAGFQGDIASLQINKGKSFTADEVLQQYNATK